MRDLSSARGVGAGRYRAPMVSLGEVADLVHEWFPPATAESWDRVGLVVGDRSAPVRRILLAVDPTLEVVREAAAYGADLLITHHPLLLRGVHAVATGTPKGRIVTELIRSGCGLLCVHTNADRAAGGVAEAMAAALGLADVRPLAADLPESWDKLTTYVPLADADRIRSALAAAGAGQLGAYDACSFSVPGEGRFLPRPGAMPAIGSVGVPEAVEETRIECLLPAVARSRVVAALVEAHPYEEPAYDVVALASTGPGRTGIGRVGTVEGLSLRGLAERVAAAVPATAHGIRVSGDPARMVRTVAVSPGAGDSMFDAVLASGAEAYVTSDLRHHPAAELIERDSSPGLIDVSHWAGEWPWLPALASRLDAAVGPRRGGAGDTVESRVSTLVTDPWTFRI